jgi:(1->4)-alpha-D-glucan 1-alpha-D-glucosylmutase
VLSELPREWGAAITRWSRLNRRHRRDANGESAPSRNDEYLLYQVMLGAWPLEELDDERRPEFVRRIQEYMAKATREAKVHTSWINPNEAYDDAIQQFVAAILDPKKSRPFLADFARFQRQIARVGAVNSLGQTLLKLTSPGVPDIYQGNDLWDLSLVDPDNRRPVDYHLRQRTLGTLQRALSAPSESSSPDTHPPTPIPHRPSPVTRHPSPITHHPSPNAQRLARRLVDGWTDGRIKQYVTWRALTVRREHADLFTCGAYLPLTATGPLEEHLCAFVRELGDQQVIVAVPRLSARLLDESPDGSDHGPLRFRAGAWDGTALLLPDRPGQRYRSVFSGQSVETVEAKAGTGGARSALPLSTLFSDVPVILLVRE